MSKALQIALGEYGNAAFPGKATNPQVEKYFDDIGYAFINDDETPWCAAFMDWCQKRAGVTTPNKLNARSYLDFSTPTTTPEIGDIVVFWRIDPLGALGHVGFFIRQTDKMIYVLGGNQDSEVSIKPFPKTQLLGYRAAA
jgi:uncharacterized protein (TIGR02594 family)